MKTQAGIVLRHLRGLVAPTACGDVSDGQLLERFAARREEAAFAGLVRRHGPMVLGVCRRVLRQEQDAEDAFQAAFLVLARKATTISKRDSVGSWLYQVAHHVAMKARERTAKQQQRDRRAAPRRPADPLADITGRELLAVFDEELARLPERQRAPLVLCYLQGLTRDAAAQQLGCSESTLHRRLDEARERLRERLGRRGLALPAALLTAGTVAATVPRALAAGSVRMVLAKGSIVPPGVAALAREALRSTADQASKAVGVLVLAAGLVAATAGLFASQPAAAVGGDQPQAPAEPAKSPALPRPAPAAEKHEFTVAGTVMDADGKAVAGARVAVIGLAERPYRGRVGFREHETLGSGQADREGHFRIACVAESATRAPIRQVLASAPGHGLAWVLLKPETDNVALKLPPEQVIRGRLIDLQGQPAGGVRLHVAGVAPVPQPGSSSATGSSLGARPPSLPGFGGGGSTGTGRLAPDTTAPPWHNFAAQPARLDPWPAAVATGQDGRFVVRGLGKEQDVKLLVTDPRFARQHFVVSTTEMGKAEAVEHSLDPAHLLEGKVVGEDTGQPIGKKVLLDVSMRGEVLQVWADEKGEFRVNCPPGRVTIEPFPPNGSPYLSRITSFEWPKGKVKHAVQVGLPRGALVRGRVKEADSGRGVAAAELTYVVRQDNPFAERTIRSWKRFPGEYVRSADDGSFEATVYPGQGTLLVRAPTRDYILRRTDMLTLARGDKGGSAVHAAGWVTLDLKVDEDPPEVTLNLQRGVTVKGRVLDPDGKPVNSAVLYHALGLRDHGDVIFLQRQTLEPVPVTGGAFVLNGLDPKAKLTAFVLDPKNEWGARAEVVGEETTIRLQPCGKIRLRLVTTSGKPSRGHSLSLQFSLEADPSSSLLQAAAMGSRDSPPRSDAEGRLTIGGLIPGVTYRFNDGSRLQEVTVEAGQTKELPDITFRGAGGFGGGLPPRPPQPGGSE
jgi:RNA polymerase sigma factor (sigma-70 family)